MPESLSSYWDLVEPVFEKINTADEVSFLTSVAGVPRPIVLLHAAHFCLAEVHNGGFLQFLWNSTGVLAPESVEGFKAIGMPKLASTVEASMAPLGSPYPRDRDARWDALLAASKCSQIKLEKIFKTTSNFYLGFEEATQSLSFDTLNEQAWTLARGENGGFQEAATRYAQAWHPIQ
jgi:hypothetical protein